MSVFACFIAVVSVYAFTLCLYALCNKGLSNRAWHQQAGRFLIAAVLALLPLMVSGVSPWRGDLLLAALTALAWMVTYPLTFHLTNRRVSPDYDHGLDHAFGLYLYGILTALGVLLTPSTVGAVVVGLVGALLLMLPLVEVVWYLLYHTCIDTNGIKILQETNVNEVIEFFHSFAWWRSALMLLSGLLLPVVCVVVCLRAVDVAAEPTLWRAVACGVVAVVLVWLCVKRHHGTLWRTGIVMLASNVKDYVRRNAQYRQDMQRRLANLRVEPLGQPSPAPRTIIMVIGESACRDFMTVYHPEQQPDNTPWMTRMARDQRHCEVFRHPYSCAMQTVPTLEKALTEYNQYNGGAFNESVSIIDIARRLGYHTRWYSNQGHIGNFDTPITLVAETADVARWTHQEVGRTQYDEGLLDFLSEINPEENNFVVFHLKGSHFPFANRYPETFAPHYPKTVEGNIANYRNSLAYTDHILQQIYNYGIHQLHLEAMVYFSDHATEPGQSRKPNFNSFQMTRIPLVAWYSDSFIMRHRDRYDALMANRDRYFTNDLVYEMMCGIFDIRSNHFDESASLASPRYRFRRKDLLTYEGRKHISEDEDILE